MGTRLRYRSTSRVGTYASTVLNSSGPAISGSPIALCERHSHVTRAYLRLPGRPGLATDSARRAKQRLTRHKGLPTAVLPCTPYIVTHIDPRLPRHIGCSTRPGTVFVQASCQARLIAGHTPTRPHPGTPYTLACPRDSRGSAGPITGARPLFPIGLIACLSGAPLPPKPSAVRPSIHSPSACCRPDCLGHVLGSLWLRQRCRTTL